MTTQVTVETFGHEVEVSRLDPETGKQIIADEIQPIAVKRTYVVHDRQALNIREVKQK